MKMRLGDICKELPTLNKESSLGEAVSKLVESGSDVLVVVDDSKPVGMVSSFDVLERILDGAEPERIVVKEIMNITLLVLDAALSAEEAARVMLAHKHWMAVVIDNEGYGGIVTARGLLVALF
ncbi:MAG: CBS domain-containing protein [Candidatus Hydrothermarchaeales archaeon]